MKQQEEKYINKCIDNYLNNNKKAYVRQIGRISEKGKQLVAVKYKNINM